MIRLEELIKYFKKYNLDSRIKPFSSSSATVELAAKALNCNPENIAKTLSFDVNNNTILIVTSGDMKIDNAKFKNKFNVKPKMLKLEDVEEKTGYPVGGVCPFNLKNNICVFLDTSLKRFEKIYPACGTPNSAILLSIEELEKYSNYTEWIDVCKKKS